MKGADTETNIWKIRLQLMKPVTWIPLIWGVPAAAFECMAVVWGRLGRRPAFDCVPLLCGGQDGGSAK